MKWILVLLTGSLLINCSPKPISVVWKSADVYHPAFKQVLVVAILPDNDSIARMQIESGIASGLHQMGYSSTPAIKHFGREGLAGLGQESTYIKLCESGFDYILTIAFVEGPKKSLRRKEHIMSYTADFYYKRIWEYRNAIAILNDSTRYAYESILFDLGQLKAIAVLRTQSFYLYQNQETITHFPNLLLDNMRKKNILTTSTKKSPLKAF